jgi:restriction system protein
MVECWKASRGRGFVVSMISDTELTNFFMFAFLISLFATISFLSIESFESFKSKGKNISFLIVYLIMWIIVFITYFKTKTPIISVMIIVFIFITMLILTIRNIINENKRLRESGIEDIDLMDGFEFERYLKELFKSHGYKVIKTPKSGDFGADLLIEKNGYVIAIQAKRYKANVGIKAVQEIQSAMLYYSSDEAWVVTNSNFTKSAKELAKRTGVNLIDREDLISLLLDGNNDGSVKKLHN